MKNFKQNSILTAVSKVALYSAKKACGAASLFSYHQPKEPVDLMAGIGKMSSKRNNTKV